MKKRIGTLLRRSLPLLAAAWAWPGALYAASAPIAFEINVGQTHKSVRFLSRYGNDSVVFLTPQEMVLKFMEWEPEGSRRDLMRPPAPGTRPPLPKGQPVNVRMRFRGANPKAQVVGLDPLPGKSNYLVGSDRGKWRRNIARYGRVAYKDLYPGIDLVFYSKGSKLEYDFVVAPDVDPSVIDLEFSGMKSATVSAEGDLVLATDRGEVRHRKPASFQDTTTVATEFELRGSGRAGFRVKGRDASRALRIDPELVYRWTYDNFPASYWCGPPSDPYSGVCNPGETWSQAIAVDRQGAAYLVGWTFTVDFPTTGGLQPTKGDDGSRTDAFVVKLNSTGELAYATYLGGSGLDAAYGVAVDGKGQAHVIGSASADFPWVATLDLSWGGFTAKLSTDGSSLLYSIPFGGSAIALDTSGNAYLVGTATAPSPVPGTTTYTDSRTHGFVAKIDPAATSMFFAPLAYYEEVDKGWASSVAVDGTGAVYVSGYTEEKYFPTNSWGGKTTPGRYVLKLKADFFLMAPNRVICAKPGDLVNHYVYWAIVSPWAAGLYVGSGPMAIDANGNLYLAQMTGDPNQTLPTPPHVGSDLFVDGIKTYAISRIDPLGQTMTRVGTYGDVADTVTAMAVDKDGNIFLGGLRILAGYNWFVFVSDESWDSDGWVAKLDPDGQLLGRQSLGGAESGEVYGSDDEVNTLALDSEGNVYAAGLGYQHANGYGLFVAKIRGDSFGFSDPSMRGSCDNCETDNRGVPVNIYTGNVWLDQVDAVIPAWSATLELRRSYNSLTALEKRPGPFGLGWTHPYMQNIKGDASGRLRLTKADGVPVLFGTRDAQGRIKADTPATDTSWLEQVPDGYVHHFRQGGEETYDSQGRFTGFTDAAGNSTSLNYDPNGRLASVLDVRSGRHFDFGYKADDLISSPLCQQYVRQMTLGV